MFSTLILQITRSNATVLSISKKQFSIKHEFVVKRRLNLEMSREKRLSARQPKHKGLYGPCFVKICHKQYFSSCLPRIMTKEQHTCPDGGSSS